MKNGKVAILVFAFIVFSFLFMGQKRGKGPKWEGSGGWGVNSRYQRLYNLNTVEEISGTVEKVEIFSPMSGMNYGVHIILNTGKEKISVHLGPSWFIQKLDEKIEEGDFVQVKGSRVKYENSEFIIAAEVKKGDKILKLRDENGFPLWAGWRR